MSWNQGNFENFLKIAKPSLTLQQKQQTNEFWWQAYEEAYLAVVRLKQDNTTEAMFHSFRAVEGLMSKWAISSFKQDVIEENNKIPILYKSIISQYPKLKQDFIQNTEIELNLKGMQRLSEVAIPLIISSPDFKVFWKNARTQRNNLFHRIGGMTKKDVFQAWGNDINDENKWEKRILNCLNLVAEQHFQSLTQASLFASTHQKLNQAIASYYPDC